MKRIILEIVLCAVLAMFVIGCEPSSVQELAAQQDVLQQQIEIVQAAATQMTNDLAISGIVEQDTVDKVAKINAEADKVQAQITLLAQALKDVPLTGDTAQDFIAQLQAANIASSGFNPYVLPVGTALSILSIILGWFVKRNAGIAAAAETKYQAHKQGVERTMKEVSASPNAGVKAVESQLYDNIGEARANLGVG